MKLVCAVLLVAAACGGGEGDGPKGTFTASWTLTDTAGAPTCDSYKIADVVVTATDTMTGNTKMVSTPCTAGMVTTEELALGTYRITLDAMGTEGDKAGTNQGMGALTAATPDVTLAPATIAVLAPAAKLHETWKLTHAGTAATCASVQNNGVSFTVLPLAGDRVSDIWDCTETAALVDVPYSHLAVSGQLLNPQSTPIATSVSVDVPAFRGTATALVTIDF